MNFKSLIVIAAILVLAAYTSAQSSRSATRTQCNNACEDVNSPQCGNNGITYRNMCRFNCAKAGNIRLRIVKSGSCAGTSLREYRGQATVAPTRGGGFDSWFRL